MCKVRQSYAPFHRPASRWQSQIQTTLRFSVMRNDIVWPSTAINILSLESEHPRYLSDTIFLAHWSLVRVPSLSPQLNTPTISSPTAILDTTLRSGYTCDYILSSAQVALFIRFPCRQSSSFTKWWSGLGGRLARQRILFTSLLDYWGRKWPIATKSP